MACLEYAVLNGCEMNKLTCLAAAEGGYLEALRFLHDKGCPWDNRTTYEAARNGHRECLKFAFENGCPLPDFEDERWQVAALKKPGIATTIVANMLELEDELQVMLKIRTPSGFRRLAR